MKNMKMVMKMTDIFIYASGDNDGVGDHDIVTEVYECTVLSDVVLSWPAIYSMSSSLSIVHLSDSSSCSELIEDLLVSS